MKHSVGNLDSFQLGMGLKATPGQVIPAKNALAGYNFSGLEDNQYLLIGFAVLILLIFLK